MRHATAPGIGDPPGFRLDDCATQRNLSAKGRAEARQIGAGLRAAGIRAEAVYSSQWCRCLETAQLLGLGPVTAFAPLNSFFDRPQAYETQMAELKPWAATARPKDTIFLVTHQVVITALTGVVPASGEIVVVRGENNGHLTVIGRIPSQ
jgi:broad specificity phosphatase PhoE